jgi:hypothetical protein
VKRRFAITIDDEALDAMNWALGYAIGRLKHLPERNPEDAHAADELRRLSAAFHDRVEDP